MDDNNARARLLAVEVLLAEPELLGNDALEADLYILRDALRAGAAKADAHRDANVPHGPDHQRLTKGAGLTGRPRRQTGQLMWIAGSRRR
jgi:hypothetical protein